MSEEKQMTVIEHLQELRGRLIKSAIALTVIVLFSLPFVSQFLKVLIAKLGIVTPTMMSTYRKYALLAMTVIAAVITPTADPFNMLLVMIPLAVLYEISILMAKLA